VVFAGDSLTEGYAKNFRRASCNGKSIFQMEADFNSALSARPRVIIVLGGTNDVFNEVSADKIFESIKRMSVRAQDDKIMFFVGTIPPMGKYFNKHKPWEKKYIEKQIEILNFLIRTNYPNQYIDFNDFLRDENNHNNLRFSNDGLHPADYFRMRIFAVNKINELFEKYQYLK